MAFGSWPTISDVASRSDSTGKLKLIAEMLSQSIVLPKDMPFLESSETFGHEWAYRDSIPAGKWRQINMGLPYSKSTTGKARIGLADLEDWSQVDQLLCEGSPMGVEGYRESEDVAFLEGLGQTVEQTMWYGNTAANPAQFSGFATFYNTINTANAPNAANVINGLGSGVSNASIYLIAWGARTMYGLFPRGTRAGLTMEDMGNKIPGYDSFGNPFKAYTSWYRHLVGLCPHDWRYAARIANIDVTTAGLAGPNALDIFATIRQMELLLPTLTTASSGITESDAPDDPAPGIRPVFYCNRTVRHYMDVQRIRDNNVLLGIDDYAGKPVDGINRIPLRVSDQLLITETAIS